MAITTDIDKFRLELGDTPAAYGLAGTRPVPDPEFQAAALLNDDEISYFLGKHPTNLLLAVADACDALAARFARQVDFAATSEKRFDLSQKTEHYLVIGARLRERALLEGDNSGTADLTATDGQIVHVQQSTTSTVTATFEAADVATSATGAVNVVVTRENGTAVRTDVAAATGNPGQYRFAVTPADTAALDRLKLVWTGTIAGAVQTITTCVEVRGAHLFSIAAARQLRPLNDTAAYPTSRIVEARTLAEIALERACGGMAFAPAYFRVRLASNGRTNLALRVTRPLTITAATIGDTALDVDDLELDEDDSSIYRSSGWTSGWTATGRRNVTITGTHGHPVPPPQVSLACLQLARECLVRGADADELVHSVPECRAVIDQYGVRRAMRAL